MAALIVFGLMVTAGPLAFGAGDRLTQIVLAGLLSIGLWLVPPVSGRLGRYGNLLILAVIGLALAKEFLPAAWFGDTQWRSVLTASYDVAFPPTHHPEPGRAVDALLGSIVAVMWFLWIRTLAIPREDRVVLAWILFGAAAIVAAVSFATRGIDPQAIYGLRYTLGWTGFGPFPNRNHTASFLAMGAVLGCGCATWAGMKKRYAVLGMSVAALGLIVAALLTTQSRGGLVVFAGGMTVFLGLVMLKLRDRRALAVALAGMLLVGALGLVFGAQVIARFSSEHGGEVSNNTRISVWQDTLVMWKDAPLLGHGAGSFGSVFPLYQQIALDDQVVLHPESSWLQWLAEMGAVPVISVCLGVVALLLGGLRNAFRQRNSFFLQGGAIGAVMVLLAHCAFDVPGQRWGTMGFALAALAIACPAGVGAGMVNGSRRSAFVPLVVAGFWSVPLFMGGPAWSPLALTQLISRDRSGGAVKLDELERALRFFPLNPALHQAIGVRQAAAGGAALQEAQEHFRIAARLVPGSWSLLIQQARASRRAPGFALHCWQMAVERGNRRRGEILRSGVQETARFPGAAAAWSSYAEAHPDLLLAYSATLPAEAGRPFFETWWKTRGESADDLTQSEIDEFYTYAPQWGTAEQLEQWIARHPQWRARDASRWASLFLRWGKGDRAWEVLSTGLTEPSFPDRLPGPTREDLEQRWETSPHDLVNARALAHVYAAAGKDEASGRIILAVAERPQAPLWFLQKAGFLLARQGKPAEAAAVLLRLPR
ncbi:MAG TPA: O-antigen ligase family protein [Chthoniobacteraceae bacterium]